MLITPELIGPITNVNCASSLLGTAGVVANVNKSRYFPFARVVSGRYLQGQLASTNLILLLYLTFGIPCSCNNVYGVIRLPVWEDQI